MSLTPKKSKISSPIIFVCLAILLGSFVRLTFVFNEVFPLNDGGLFYTMTSELISNGFRVPATTSYNHLQIPFAYPPLQFYIAGLLSTLFKWNLLDIFRIFPAVIACLCIPAFYLLARELLRNELHAALATLIFSLTPASFDWLIMGGGVTRAPAFLLALLALVSIYRLYTRKEKGYIISTALLASLAVLSHPETALHTAASALVFFMFFGRNKSGVLRSLVVAGLVLVCTSPWWLNALTQHGIAPFLSAGQTGWHGILAVFKLFFANQYNEYQITPITILALVGLFIVLAQRKFFLPAWFLVIFLSEPRSAPLFTSPIIAIFAAYSLIQILNLLNGMEKKPGSETDLSLLFSGRLSKILFGILFAQWIFSSYAIVINLANGYFLDDSEMNAFNWVKKNTSPDSRFIVISGNAPFTDPISEWFPAMTDRLSLGTAQGHEWVDGKAFNTTLEDSLALQQCATSSPDCIKDWSVTNAFPYNYVFVDIAGTNEYPAALTVLLSKSGDYRAVYDLGGVVIFEVIGD